MLKRLFLTLLLLASLMPAACAQEGYFIRSDTSTLTDPVAGFTVMFDATTMQFKVWNGADWQVITEPTSNYSAATAPTVDDDTTEGYAVGSRWVDTTTNAIYLCSDPSAAAAVWNLLNPDQSIKLTAGDWLSDWLVSGLAGSVPGSGLSAVTTSGVAYVDGKRTVRASTTYAYTASKDTYDFLQSDGTWHHHAVNNGAGQPGDTGLLIQKVVSNGTDVTAVTALAATAPQISLTAATSGGQAINLTQGNALYIPRSLSVANGDLIVGNGTAGTFIRLAAGSNSTLLGVVPAGVGLQYWTLVGAGGISITPSGTNITFDGSAFALKGANADITSLSSLSTPLSIVQGGTAGNSAGTARAALAAAVNGANNDITSLTAIQHIVSAGSAPSIAGGSGAGGAAVVSVAGTDIVGTVTVTTDVGDTPAASATIVTVTFATAYGAAPRVIFIPANGAAADLTYGIVRCDQGDTTTAHFLLKSGATPLPATTAATYKWNYVVVQ